VRSLRLDTLHLTTPNIAVRFSDLERLISTDLKHLTLKRVVLDLVAVVGKVGQPVTVANLRSWWPFTFDARTGTLPSEDEVWEEPYWADEDDPEWLEHLEQLGRAGGVEVMGTAVDALRVQQACDAQKAVLFEMAEHVEAMDREMRERNEAERVALERGGLVTAPG